MGRSMYELLHGSDCPSTAKMIDIVQYSATSTTGVVRFKNAICVFEQSAGMPVRRHYDTNGGGGFNFVTSAPLSYLVVRVMSTVYNYDYIYDFHLHPNGIVEVEMHASGYLQAVPFYNMASTLKYGSKVLEYTSE
jgi:diamine oxidase